MATEALKEEAKKAVCSCYFWDLCNAMDDMTSEYLNMIINKPYYCHYINGEDTPDCPEYQTERAEAIRDGMKEDGINV